MITYLTQAFGQGAFPHARPIHSRILSLGNQLLELQRWILGRFLALLEIGWLAGARRGKPPELLAPARFFGGIP